MEIDPKHTFVTSDCHFGSYKKSVFREFTEDEENELIQNWNSIVGKNDLVIYNGDFCDSGVLDAAEYKNRLNGKIVLVKGNHDFLSLGAYEGLFDEIYDELKLDQFNIVIRHIPQENTLIPQVYGHLHHGILNPLDPFMNYCSCIKFHNRCPVRFEDVVSYFRLQNLEADC